jgi:flavin-binding protein dodecin
LTHGREVPRQRAARRASPGANWRCRRRFGRQGGFAMTEHVYKTIELTGASKLGVEDAVKKALAKAAKTLHNLRWFQVTEIRGNVDGGAVSTWQVSLKVGFTLDD